MDADTRRILVHALGAVLTVGLLGGLAACAATKPEVTPSAEDAAPAVTVRAYDAMAEAVNNLYKTELIRQQGPWRTVEQVELATLKYVWWWNHERLHGELDMRTPAEVEQAYYAETETLLSPTG
ncbi:transposase [Leucobacter sp. CSA1]|uniref:Transposase n=1 Tax=Leucobacter chromiisoli TaxID=2796471 RepID=A0A934UUU5_9MICO|nr:transposase [Leucobacter chromiisoli]